MTSPRVQNIAFLIKNHYAGGFTYQGHHRIFSPYLLGVTRDGREVLHAYQFQGANSKGPVTPESGAGWRFFYLDEIEGEVEAVLGMPWYPLDLRKSTELTTYNPPKFIATVLALAESPE